MAETKFPYEAWVLTAELRPKQEVFVRVYKGIYVHDYHITNGGKQVHVGGIFKTEKEALAAARTQLDRQKAELKKRRATWAKRDKWVSERTAAIG